MTHKQSLYILYMCQRNTQVHEILVSLRVREAQAQHPRRTAVSHRRQPSRGPTSGLRIRFLAAASATRRNSDAGTPAAANRTRRATTGTSWTTGHAAAAASERGAAAPVTCCRCGRRVSRVETGLWSVRQRYRILFALGAMNFGCRRLTALHGRVGRISYCVLVYVM